MLSSVALSCGSCLGVMLVMVPRDGKKRHREGRFGTSCLCQVSDT